MQGINLNRARTDHQIDKAVHTLAQGGVIAFPTETFYGLGVNPFDVSALRRLFEIKQREANKAILVLVPDQEMLTQIVADIPMQYQPLMDRFWPGPLTLIFPAHSRLPSLLTGDSGTIGVRISPHPLVAEIFKKWPYPITATSANISGTSPAKDRSEVTHHFPDELDYILDGGETTAGLCSTIIGLKDDLFEEIRRGEIPFRDINDALTNAG